MHPWNARDSRGPLESIISDLMQNSSSDAAPPASKNAIEKLERRQLDDEMRPGTGDKAVCTLCLEEVSEVVVMPCQHWFREACLRKWLLARNTCPLCRAPISGQQDNNCTRTAGPWSSVAPTPQ